jgi:hypothetical protein
MFWLLLILAQSPDHVQKIQILDRDLTESECQASRTRVQEGMQHAYPGDDSFRLVCVKR